MRKLRTMHLFAGAGGGLLADVLLGHQPVCAVEIDKYCQQVLSARQADGTFPWFPIFGDIKEFDGRPWRGIVDVVSGGFPCQDISVAGNGAGIDGERSGLWREMARIIGEVQPRYVFVENSPALVTRGLGTVLGDLATLGFDARWTVLGASDVGAPHRRERVWILAHAPSVRQPGSWKRIDASHCAEDRSWKTGHVEHDGFHGEWPVEPGVGRTLDGLAEGLDAAIAAGMSREFYAWKTGFALKGVQDMRNRVQPQGVQRSSGRCDRLQQEGALQPDMREQQGEHQAEKLSMEVTQASQSELRSMRGQQTASGTSLRPGSNEQRSIEPSDSMQELSRLLARYGQEAWASGSWEDAVPRVTDERTHRTHRLKAIGNGQVPLCAATAWRLLENI